jgi:Fic family protein
LATNFHPKILPKMHEYQKSHPWITFHIDLRRMPATSWILLGEAQSKCHHISQVPLKPELAERLHSTYLAKSIHGTTAIEGNTLTEEEVRRRIEGKLDLPSSLEYQGQEVDNILEGYNRVREQILKNVTDEINVDEIKTYNKIILNKLDLPDHVVPGQTRNASVGVLQYRGTPPNDCEYLLSRMCEWLNKGVFRPKDNRVAFGIIRAILAHLYLAWIHPFGDGNGRCARLLELKIMLSSGTPVPASHLLSSHYNKTRTEYYRQLDYASKSRGDIFPFITYAVQGLVDELQGQLDFIYDEQLQIFWRDFIYERFSSEPGKIARRRRQVALDLALQVNPVPAEKVRVMSAKVAEGYSGKTIRTVQRDLDELVEMGVVKKEKRGYTANFLLLSQFFADVPSLPTP